MADKPLYLDEAIAQGYDIIEAPGPEAYGFDNTALSMFKECPQKYFLAIECGLRPHGTAAPLAYGAAYHSVLEHFDSLIARGHDRDFALRECVKLVFTLVGTSEQWADDKRNRVTLLRSLIWYEDNYRRDAVETFVLPNGQPAVELTFRVELPLDFLGKPTFYTGHIDRLVRYNGQLFPMERKSTTSSLSDQYYDRYTFSSQISGYVMACQVNFNLEVGGAIIDSAQVGATYTRFGRRIARRVPAHTHEWLEDTIYWIGRLEDSKRRKQWPRNTESCNKYSGCQFRDICFTSPGAREAMIKGNYRVEHWDPLKIRGGAES